MSKNSGSSSKVEFWTAAVELFQESQLSCTEFCNREGLSYSTFCRWRDKLMSQQENLTDQQDTKATLAKSQKASTGNSIEDDGNNCSDNGNYGKDVKCDDGKSGQVKFVSAGLIDGGAGSAAGIEVRFSSGVSVNLSKGFDSDTFKEVVSILEAELC